jgi:hypothetical protein
MIFLTIERISCHETTRDRNERPSPSGAQAVHKLQGDPWKARERFIGTPRGSVSSCR